MTCKGAVKAKGIAEGPIIKPHNGHRRGGDADNNQHLVLRERPQHRDEYVDVMSGHLLCACWRCDAALQWPVDDYNGGVPT